MNTINLQNLYMATEPGAISNNIGKTIILRGLIYKIRVMSGFSFVLLQSGSTTVQCVHSPEFSNFPLSDLIENMSVVFTGKVVSETRSKKGYEIRIVSFVTLSVPAELPPVVINNKELATSLDTLLDYRPITLRNERERAIFRLQAGICEGMRGYFSKNNFTEIHTPKIVSGGAEGGANIFNFNYFGKDAYLCQSPQLYKQIMVGVFGKVYEIAPVFRAEKHSTCRHINEYTSVDMEIGFINDFTDIMKAEIGMLNWTLEHLKQNYKAELDLLSVKLPVINNIPIIKFLEAKELIRKKRNRQITDWEDFDPEEEKILCDIVKKETDCEFVFVTHYKTSKRPFYALESKDDPLVTESFDLLFRGLEITTGGQRIHDYRQQINKMISRGINPELFSGYLMAHKYGLPPHGGLGLGLERFTQKLIGFENIRRCTLFPRDTDRLNP